MAPRTQEGMALATTKNLKISTQKLNLVAAMIRGKKLIKQLMIYSFQEKELLKMY
jgi:ribosomal protein L22